MTGLSKTRLLNHRQCPRRLWLQAYQPDAEEVDPGAESRFSVGEQVGELARVQHPGGVLIEGTLREALATTNRYMNDTPCPLYEATFEVDNVLVRADLLLPETDGRWRMVEVKSAASVKDYHLDDATIQHWVTQQAGVPLSSLAIAYIDTGFIYPGEKNYDGLFAYEDVTELTTDKIDEVSRWVAEAHETLAGPDPQTPPGPQCTDPFACPFISFCQPEPDGDEDHYPPEILPYGKSVAAQLREEGYTDLRMVPDGRLEKPQHERIRIASRDNTVILEPEAREQLLALDWPRYYLDFETIQFAVPIWAGTRPYAQIPFQWSCHIEHADGQIDHREFLAEDDTDPRRRFADSLIDTVGQQGPIFVYNLAFERSRLRELADTFDDLAPALNAIIERLVDLLPIARAHYYHPAMRGSWSIKAVLPTIAPELIYDELTVSHGGMAQEAFMTMIQPNCPEETYRELRQGLLEYCQLDTWAMVRIAHYFEGRADAQ